MHVLELLGGMYSDEPDLKVLRHVPLIGYAVGASTSTIRRRTSSLISVPLLTQNFCHSVAVWFGCYEHILKR